jgi:N-acetylated-alpha-linked acidic dipeptidase
MYNYMQMIRSSIALALVVPLAAAAPTATSDMGIRGFTASQVTAERRYEAIVNSSPNATQAMRDELGMASYVHRMGQRGDLRSAVYFRNELRKAGWQAHLVEYDVAIAYPTVQTLTLMAPTRHDLDLYEPVIATDPYSRDHAAIAKPYSGYAADGDVTGPVIYANYGKPDDYAKLASMHISVNGAIVLVRAGGGSLTRKAYEGASRGVRAVLVFADPMKGGYWDGDVYPKGPYRPLGGAVRNTLTILDDPGDPTAIGIPVPGAKHKPFSSMKLPSIPEMPVTALVARELLEAMDGPSVPSEWHPGFAMAIHTGGSVQAHFVIKSKRFIGPIWDVIATMPGIDAQQMVVVGGHRDAWTYGAIDPISGSVDMLQLGRALGKLKAQGWKPHRTIVIGSWDGEETNLFGSATWVYQHEPQLRSGCVAYINTDEVAFGPNFGAYATPDLAGFVRDVAHVAIAPDGTTLDAYWRARDPKLTVDPMGGGSDHEAFVYHEGLPGVGAGYTGPFGTYHSAYDDPASLRIFDPGMREAVAAARYTGLLVLRLAEATYPDVRLGDVAGAIQQRITTAKANALLAQAQDFTTAAKALDDDADAAVQNGDTARAQADQVRLRNAESAFFNVNASTWNRSLLFAPSGPEPSILPTLEKAQTQILAALRAATAAARGS